jgi:hypothetical protein
MNLKQLSILTDCHKVKAAAALVNGYSPVYNYALFPHQKDMVILYQMMGIPLVADMRRMRMRG